MRTYGQYCPLARSLDVVGERWTLLIIRELSIRESRYSDLRDALPGIATNLLADRLRQLERDGVIEHFDAPRPVGAGVYRLTARGRDLVPAIEDLARWGVALLTEGRNGDAFRTHWLGLALPLFYADADLSDVGEELEVVVRSEGEPCTVRLRGGRLEVRPGAPPGVAAVQMEGEPEAVIAYFAGSTARGKTGAVRLRGSAPDKARLHRLIKHSRLAAQKS